MYKCTSIHDPSKVTRRGWEDATSDCTVSRPPRLDWATVENVSFPFTRPCRYSMGTHQVTLFCSRGPKWYNQIGCASPSPLRRYTLTIGELKSSLRGHKLVDQLFGPLVNITKYLDNFFIPKVHPHTDHGSYLSVMSL